MSCFEIFSSYVFRPMQDCYERSSSFMFRSKQFCVFYKQLAQSFKAKLSANENYFGSIITIIKDNDAYNNYLCVKF